MADLIPACLFPETVPSPQALAKLLIFFNHLFYYQPTEAAGNQNRPAALFTNLCTGYTPAPLGNDLSRFNRLLREMESSKPEEFSRLFSVARTPVVTGQTRDQDETTAARVYSALHQDGTARNSARLKEYLWQARLVLKLAEMLDRKETEIRQGLAQISSAEEKLFASLEGLGDAEAEELAELRGPVKPKEPGAEALPPVPPLSGTSGPLLALRTKAWAQLYLAGSPAPLPMILVAGNPESGSFLLDAYENTWGRVPQKLFSLPIPDFSAAGIEETRDQFLASRNAFRRAAQDHLEYITKFLRETASLSLAAPKAQVTFSALGENISAWEVKTEHHFPLPGAGLTKLAFYSFPCTSFTELFLRLFRLEEIAVPTKQEHPTGLLAILDS
jgi:hypothetical protein